MSYPVSTYELRIKLYPQIELPDDPATSKSRVVDLLRTQGIDSFVEGAVDDLDIDNEYGLEQPNLYESVGGDDAPVSVYKFSREILEGVQTTLEHRLGDRVSCAIIEHQTSTWLEGWKESFRPIATDRFYIYPPWEKCEPVAGAIPICIEPGMAFGTGQHATTLLCLEEIATIEAQSRASGLPLQRWRVSDVGTGTAILSIAMAKLGVENIKATDIDPDAIVAAKRNANDNDVVLDLEVASVPRNGTFNLIVANILAVVLKQLMPDLARATAPQGFVLMSGLLVEQADELIELAAGLNLRFIRNRIREDWCSLLLQKVAD